MGTTQKSPSQSKLHLEELSRIKTQGQNVFRDWKPWRPATSKEKLNNLKRKKSQGSERHTLWTSQPTQEGYSIAPLSHFYSVNLLFSLVKHITMFSHLGYDINKMSLYIVLRLLFIFIVDLFIFCSTHVQYRKVTAYT